MLLSTRAAVEGSGSETLLHSGGVLCSIHAVTRQLKREQNSLFNCLNSIVSDRSFVEEIRSLYPGIPLLANLRCGLWYTPNADGTCYFKSTDGHTGKWAFSTVRLNLHVARLASVKGGVMMVDATRKGKTFTDAFSKTVPIWCAVLNRAVARLRQLQQQGQGPIQQSSSTAAGRACAACDGVKAAGRDADQAVQPPCLSDDWDCAVHLPLWVPRNEALQIEARLEGWVDQLMAIGADIKGLEQVMTKPLRPLWVSQSSRIWLDQVCQPEDQPFTPLILISASEPRSYERKASALTAAVDDEEGDAGVGTSRGVAGFRTGKVHQGGRRRSHRQGQAGAGADMASGASGAEGEDGAEGAERNGSAHSRSSSDSGDWEQAGVRRHGQGQGQRHDRQHDQEEGQQACSGQGSWGQQQGAGAGAGGAGRGAQGRRGGRERPHKQRQQQVWTYVYVPGAGDDEESWAAGLTPEVFWRNWRELLSTGPMGIHDAVKAALELEQEQYKQGAAPPTAPATPAALAGGGMPCAAADTVAAVASLRHVETDDVHVRPLGCVADADASVEVVGAGIHVLGACGICLGAFHAGAAPEVWKHVQAVLDCGTIQHPTMLGEGAAPVALGEPGAPVAEGCGRATGGREDAGPAQGPAQGEELEVGVEEGDEVWHDAVTCLDPRDEPALQQLCADAQRQQQQQQQQQQLRQQWQQQQQRRHLSLKAFDDRLQHCADVQVCADAKGTHLADASAIIVSASSDDPVTDEHPSTAVTCSRAVVASGQQRPGLGPQAHAVGDGAGQGQRGTMSDPGVGQASCQTCGSCCSEGSDAACSRANTWDSGGAAPAKSADGDGMPAAAAASVSDSSGCGAACSSYAATEGDVVRSGDAERPVLCSRCLSTPDLEATHAGGSHAGLSSNLNSNSDPHLHANGSSALAAGLSGLPPGGADLPGSKEEHVHGDGGALKALTAAAAAAGASPTATAHAEPLTGRLEAYADVQGAGGCVTSQPAFSSCSGFAGAALMHAPPSANGAKAQDAGAAGQQQQGQGQGQGQEQGQGTPARLCRFSSGGDGGGADLAPYPSISISCPACDTDATTTLQPTAAALHPITTRRPASKQSSFTFCSSPRGFPCEPFISVPLECPREELVMMRRMQCEADAARDSHVEAAMNRQYASRVCQAVREVQQRCQAQRLSNGGGSGDSPPPDAPATGTAKCNGSAAAAADPAADASCPAGNIAAGSIGAAAGTNAGVNPAAGRSAPSAQLYQDAPRYAPRYAWLPVESAKASRSSLLEALPRALEFLSQHLSLGRRVLIHDALGLDQCVCVAVALLLACFDCDAPSPAATAPSVPSPSPPSTSHTPHSVDDVRSVGAGGGGDSAEEAGGVQDSVKELRQGGGFSSARFVGLVWLDGRRVVLPEGRQVTKQSVRQALAFVSSHYPQARPTRGMLKQVFNFFEQQKQQGGAHNGQGERRRQGTAAGKKPAYALG